MKWHMELYNVVIKAFDKLLVKIKIYLLKLFPDRESILRCGTTAKNLAGIAVTKLPSKRSSTRLG